MSGNLIDLRKRITAVKNTRKITQAMKTVSAAKLRRSVSEVNKIRPMMERIEFMMHRVGTAAKIIDHPFLKKRESGDTVIVAISSDKGLCGAFNAHIIKQTEKRYESLVENGENPCLILIGSKIYKHFKKRKYTIEKFYDSMMSNLEYSDSVDISTLLQDMYLDEKKNVKNVEFIHTAFTSAAKQDITIRSLFPIESTLDEDLEKEAGSATDNKDVEYIFEPSATEIFESLLPRFIDSLIYRVFLESSASEHAARMIAMDLATRNAGDMIRTLTLTMNKLRQASITKELLEIITATEALKK